MLALVGTLNYADRFLPAVLAEPIKEDLALSDTALGVINGFGFLVVYAVLGIAIARIADRGAFGLVISSCLALWGAMTMLGGAVQSGFQLALTRVGVAVGEAGSTPAAHAYVARNFPPERRAAPLAVITLAIPLASAASLIGGGLLAESLGWRTAFVVMGLISVLVAPVVRLRARAAAGHARRATATPAALGQCVGSAEEAQLPGHCFRRGLHLVRRLFVDGVRARVSGAHQGDVARRGRPAVRGGQRPDRHRRSVIVGRLADRLSLKDSRWPLWLVAAMTATMIPFSVLAFVVDSQLLCVWFIALSYVVGTAYMAPSISAIQRLARPEQRATASAVFLFFSAIVGAAGPFATGVISDALMADLGAMSLGRALFVVPAAQVLAVICYALASRWFVREMVD